MKHVLHVSFEHRRETRHVLRHSRIIGDRVVAGRLSREDKTGVVPADNLARFPQQFGPFPK